MALQRYAKELLTLASLLLKRDDVTSLNFSLFGLFLAILSGCAGEGTVPNLTCRWQRVGEIEDTVADRCLMVVTLQNARVGNAGGGEALECQVVDGGTIEWFRDGYSPSVAEVQPIYVDCSETCADYGY